jgi:hypothetical protein
LLLLLLLLLFLFGWQVFEIIGSVRGKI